MKITINGQNQTFEAPLSIKECLKQTGYVDKLVAVAVGGTFVPKSAYADTALSDGDDIEIVAPMQGG